MSGTRLPLPADSTAALPEPVCRAVRPWMMRARGMLVGGAAALVLVSAFTPAAAQAPAGERAAPLPVEDFFRPAQIRSVQLSPNGRQVAVATAGAGGRVSLWVFDLARMDQPTPLIRYKDADVTSVQWLNDTRLLFSLGDLQASVGEWTTVRGGLFTIASDGTGLRTLVQSSMDRPPEGVSAREPLSSDHVLLAVPRTDEGRTLIMGRMVSDRQRGLREVLPQKLDIDTGRTTSLALGAPDNVQSWLFDASGQPRVAIAAAADRRQVWWRPEGATQWRKIQDVEALSAAWEPRFLDRDGRLYVRDMHQGYMALKRFDFDKLAPEPEPIVSTPGFDFNGDIATETATGQMLGARVVTDAAGTVWLDPVMKQRQAMVDQRLPGRVNSIQCRRCTRPDAVLLVSSWSDQDPGRWFVVDVASGRWNPIGASRPHIEPRRMATVDFHRIRARDGRDLPVWVTTPAGTPSGTRLPVVVMVHGGPWVRGGNWVWNPMNQFLASRGYLVVEPEFRGSEGYGEAHFRAGWKQWGLAMQDDVTDALKWAVSKGLADPARACIAGASYGGYSALMGLVRDPGLYRCGVAWVAVTDPFLVMEWRWDNDVGDNWTKYGARTLIGDRDKDGEALRAASPVLQASKIREPVLLAFGGEDRRVPMVHGTRMREALRAAGKEPVWITYPTEGHGWAKFENQVDFARRVEAFLGQHLK